MTLDEQIDKLADSTRFSVEILCSIAKRQGKEEMQDLVSDAITDIKKYLTGEGFGSEYINDVVNIIHKHTGVSE